MTGINPNNYEGASITLVGRAGGPAQPPAYDKDGTKGVLELSVAVSQGYKKDDQWVDTGTAWYVLSAAGSYADVFREVGKGDKVRLDDGKLEVREFDRKDGTKGQQFTVKYGTLVILEKKDAAPSDGFTPASRPPEGEPQLS